VLEQHLDVVDPIKTTFWQREAISNVKTPLAVPVHRSLTAFPAKSCRLFDDSVQCKPDL